MKSKPAVVALAGQPNCGKSTVFNMLTGARQHVANYPGVTVEKKTGIFTAHSQSYELVDLPGTYALTSYSLEERVTRDFLFSQEPDLAVGVVDASNLTRHLAFLLQVMEMGRPVLAVMNKMDVARRANIQLDLSALEDKLQVPVIPTVGSSGQGKQELQEAIHQSVQGKASIAANPVDYGSLEKDILALRFSLEQFNVASPATSRWLAVKLLEGDTQAREWLQEHADQAQELLAEADSRSREFAQDHGQSVQQHTGLCRYNRAKEIHDAISSAQSTRLARFTDRIDSIVCHKLLGPIILVAVIYLLYQLSIVQGYKVTNYTWPILEWIKGLVASVLPQSGFVFDPVLRSLGLWFMDSVNALLNYIPIFLILFALIAFLEDVGYMPRMAFLMDRLFKRFGLHGQSTLPMVLGGVYVGGCAVPAVMSTKGIPDDRARLATILIIPMLNCLAKVPLYILLVNAYFPGHKGLAMFFISTITLFMALPVAKILSMTVLKNRETAPFLMEMPSYHLPTVKGVLGRSLERTWLFVRKIVTIVAAVAVIVFVLLRFPGLNEQQEADYAQRAGQAVAAFQDALQGTPYAGELPDQTAVMRLLRFQDEYKQARRQVGSRQESEQINKKFEAKNPDFYTIVKRGRKPAAARQAGRAVQTLDRERMSLRREIRSQRIDASFLGQIGRALEPVTQWAGFNWRINVSLLSALAAKESLVATLGAIYQQDEDSSGSLESRMKEQEKGYTPLHALALILFMALYPPCLATLIGIKIQTLSTKWMLFSLAYQISLGIGVAVLIFSGGQALGLSGLQAMFGFYALMVLITIGMGLIPHAKRQQDDR
ncbi:ferrous iron transport protein B [Desulfovermiculus halophilus]|jgi:ferrous iron transport protein B|uniref:ferrous iron transport protein B n=1 Tax=Desulfovermiculus halophilus TaxID=339722 RepID=UPI00048406D4|nr:ferrous iron transport protein B [Desulfovermiculus halophilus]